MVALRNTSLLLPLKLFLSQSLRPNLRSHWHHLQVTPPSVSILPLLTPRHFLAKWQVTTELCEQIISALTTIDEGNTENDIVRSVIYLLYLRAESLTPSQQFQNVSEDDNDHVMNAIEEIDQLVRKYVVPAGLYTDNLIYSFVPLGQHTSHILNASLLIRCLYARMIACCLQSAESSHV